MPFYQILKKENNMINFGHSAFNNNGGAGGFSGFEGFDFGNMSDIFDDLFGGMGFSGSSRSRSRKTNSPKKGNDILYRMTIDFEEAVYGTKKDVKIDVRKIALNVMEPVASTQKPVKNAMEVELSHKNKEQFLVAFYLKQLAHIVTEAEPHLKRHVMSVMAVER